MITFDLGNVLVNLWSSWKRDKEWQAWLRLILSTIYSGVIAFLGTDGLALVAGAHWLVALGSGMIAAAASVTGVLLSTQQGRSISLSLPRAVVTEVQKEQNDGQVNIQGGK